MERSSVAITIAFCLLLTGIMSFTSMNVGGEGPVEIHPHMEHSASYPGLLQGQIIKYNWSTDDQEDSIDFHIRDSITGIIEVYYDISNRSGEFVVPANEDYTLEWYNDNVAGSAFLTYSVEIKDPPAVEDLDLTVVTSFSENPCLQGNTTILNITITNPNQDQVKIEDIGAHFDFFPLGIYVEKEGDLSKVIGTDQSFYWDLDIEVDSSAAPGVHTYDIKIGFDGRIMGNWYTKSWLSGNLSDLSVFEMDRDHDGIPDSKDAFPDNQTEWNDTDSDGKGDNSDKFPLDPLEWNDTDNDGVGDNRDKFPADPLEWNDTDDDGYGDNADRFKTNPLEWNDTDNDGVGDNSDRFPEDPAASIDTDRDGYPDAWNPGKTAEDSTTGLKIDAYPVDAAKFEKEEEKSTLIILLLVVLILIIVLMIILIPIIAIVTLIKALNRQKRLKEGSEEKSEE